MGYTSLLNRYEPTVDITKEDDITQSGQRDFTKIISISTPITLDKEDNVSFRDWRPGAANYYIDGETVQGEIGIPTSSIYSMKIYSGGIPARFGNTRSSVIEVRTKSYFDFFE